MVRSCAPTSSAMLIPTSALSGHPNIQIVVRLLTLERAGTEMNTERSNRPPLPFTNRQNRAVKPGQQSTSHLLPAVAYIYS